MADTIVTPNMNLPNPVPTECPGPEWAEFIQACIALIDSHDHSTGQGVPITPAGLNINSALTMAGNNLTDANSVGFSTLLAVLTSLRRTLQVVDKDLYYVDGNGNSVRITQGGAVTGSTGTITGLPSGTASASYAGATFTFQSATNTPATMNVGPLVIGRVTAGSATVTVTPNSGQSVSYTLTLPAAQGAANTIMVNDGSGNLSFLTIGSILTTAGIGTVVSGYTPGVSATTSWQELVPISLTGGTWQLSGGIQYYNGTGNAFIYGNINSTTASESGTSLGFNRFTGLASNTSIGSSLAIPPFTVTLGGSTAYYLNAKVDSSNTGLFVGSILAVRLTV